MSDLAIDTISLAFALAMSGLLFMGFKRQERMAAKLADRAQSQAKPDPTDDGDGFSLRDSVRDDWKGCKSYAKDPDTLVVACHRGI